MHNGNATDRSDGAPHPADAVFGAIERPPRVPPYLAIGLSTTVRGVARRADCWVNLRHLANMIRGAFYTCSINHPIKLVALPEGAITGFTDEAFDVDHVVAARELFIDIPGEETDFLGELAKQFDTFIIAQCKARWPEVMKDRFFNTAFIISPEGKVVHKYAKNHVFPRERSCTPHDIYDRWVEVFGDGLEAFYPVYKSPIIGNIGTIVCNDGHYPEAVRALALNGAEVVYRPSMSQPMTGNGTWEIQNRAHAVFNNVYVIAPNIGPYYLTPGVEHPYDVAGGMAHIVDYTGKVVCRSASGADTVVAALIDIEQLRLFRERTLRGNWLKDLRTEIFAKMYAEPIMPKNMWLHQDPLGHEALDAVYRQNIRRLQERGTYTPPSAYFPGARFLHPIPNPEDRSLARMRELLWDPWGAEMAPHLHTREQLAPTPGRPGTRNGRGRNGRAAAGRRAGTGRRGRASGGP